MLSSLIIVNNVPIFPSVISIVASGYCSLKTGITLVNIRNPSRLVIPKLIWLLLCTDLICWYKLSLILIIFFAASTYNFPAGVKTRQLWVRSNKGTPSSCSNFARYWLREDCDTYSSSAAFVIFPFCAIVIKYFKCLVSITPLLKEIHISIKFKNYID